MAIQQNRKRLRAHDPRQEHCDRPSKKVRARGSANFAPEFWDSLSKVWLTSRALRELDRRNNLTALPGPGPNPPAPAPAVWTADLVRFARQGGPDLCHIRGYPHPTDDRPSMSSSRRTKSTTATSTSTARKSSAYDNNFEQCLTDHHIHLPLRPSQARKPTNFDDICLHLSASRRSLSPSRFDDAAYEAFLEKNEAKSEATLMRNVIPILAGTAGIANEGNLQFTNLESLTDDLTVNANPDFFDGALPGDVDEPVRVDLSQMIIPTKHATVPVVPNFFLEAKAQRGSAEVVRRQACYDGAYGARALCSLQSYGEETPVYDGKAYTFSSTYLDGQLRLFAHHVTAPIPPSDEQEYHMIQLKAYALTNDRETCVAGLGAFRNARELAQRHRNEIIQDANARARRANAQSMDQG
ncbi:hypothetical protein QBC39DRAFT_23048 [Podospora conica]|nr:hypothetical protein QBC39DRAFT_23048 [Schizothecium conicum]